MYGLWAVKKTGRYLEKERESLFLYIFAWVIIWGRLGYVLFYNLSSYLSQPLDILRVWDGGMSFHGWLVWVIVALYVFSKLHKIRFLDLSDDIALIIPVGLFFGRIGNYLNKELLWFPYTWPLAVSTPQWSFFPSPLLEALLEWIVIFVILHLVVKKQQFSGQLGSLFLILYGLFRTGIELFVRIPDPQIGYYFWFFTQGSFLSIPMIVIWVFLYIYLKNTHGSK